MQDENTMSPDSEIKAALHGLRLTVLDTLTQSQLKDLAAHLRRVADYAECRTWAITANRVKAPTPPAPSTAATPAARS